MGGPMAHPVRHRKPVAFEFVLDALGGLDYQVRPMFGATALYRGEKIILILREKEEFADDNGVWLATAPEHHESLREDFPSMRSIRIFGPGPTSWQNLPAESADFESEALKACELILQGDPRIGKIPVRKAKKKASNQKLPKKKLPKKKAATKATPKRRKKTRSAPR